MPKKYRTQVDPNKLIVDRNTGEVLGVQAKRVCESQEEFLKIYLNSIDDLISLDNRLFQVLLICLKRAEFCNEKSKEGNVFNNNVKFKEDCRRFIDDTLSNNAINQYVSRLCAFDMLLRISRGVFILNPRYFAKGQMTPNTRLELVVTYEGKNKGK